MRIQGILGVLVAAASLLPSWARAEDFPSLNDQKAWTDQDKTEFLDYLESSQPLPRGNVRQAPVAASSGPSPSEHTAYSVEFGPATATIFPFSGKGYGPTAAGLLGAKVLYEPHFYTWLRGYTGFEAEPLREREAGGDTADLTRWAVPVGLELALVPLGTPQTSYVLLRLGAVASDVSGAPAGTFATSIVGPSAAWDLGLGYERQFPDSLWRVNFAIDGLRSMGSPGGVGYDGLGATIALVRTF